MPLRTMETGDVLGHVRRRKDSRASAVKVITDVVVQKRADESDSRPPTPTEYFAALLSTLEGDLKNDEVSSDLLSLLANVLRVDSFPTQILRLKGEHCCGVLLRYAKSSKTSVRKSSLMCLAKVVQAQEPNKTSFQRSYVAKSLNRLLLGAVDDRPKIRRAVMECLDSFDSNGPWLSYRRKFWVNSLKGTNKTESQLKRTLQHISLTGILTKKDGDELFGSLLRVAKVSSVECSRGALRALRGLDFNNEDAPQIVVKTVFSMKTLSIDDDTQNAVCDLIERYLTRTSVASTSLRFFEKLLDFVCEKIADEKLSLEVKKRHTHLVRICASKTSRSTADLTRLSKMDSGSPHVLEMYATAFSHIRVDKNDLWRVLEASCDDEEDLSTEAFLKAKKKAIRAGFSKVGADLLVSRLSTQLLSEFAFELVSATKDDSSKKFDAFREHVLPRIESSDSKIVRSRLWSVLETYCDNSLNVARDFGKIALRIAEELDASPRNDSAIAKSLCALIDTNLKSVNRPLSHYAAIEDSDSERSDDDDDADDDDESLTEDFKSLTTHKSGASAMTKKERAVKHRYDSQVAQENLNSVKDLSEKLLPALFFGVEKRRRDQLDASSLLRAVTAWASVADPKFLTKMLDVAYERLRGSEIEAERKTVLNLMSALLPSISDPDAEFERASSLLSEVELLKMVVVLCKAHSSWLTSNYDRVLRLVASKEDARSIAALRKILKAMRKRSVFDSKPMEEPASVAQKTLPTIVLCGRSKSNRARTASRRCLSEIAEFLDAHSIDDGIPTILGMTLGGLSKETEPHTKACSIAALTRLTHEYGERFDLTNVFRQVVSRVCEVSKKTNNREITSSFLIFAKVCVLKLRIEVLNSGGLYALLATLHPWANDSKNKFSLKIRVVVEKAVKRLGYEEVVKTDVFDESHKVLAYVRKQAQHRRNKRSRSTINVDASEQTTRGISEGVDLANAVDVADGEVVVDSRGRVVVEEEPRSERVVDEDSSEDEGVRYGRGKRAAPRAERRKTLGSRSRAKKGTGGDLKRKSDKLEPYAYVPLDRNLLNKRKRAKIAAASFGEMGKRRKKR